MKKESIAKYRKMIRWAKKQNPYERIRSECSAFGTSGQISMRDEIGVDWSDISCPYCDAYQDTDNCKLGDGGYCDSGENCCSGLWLKMHKSRTWKTWIPAAEKVLKYIQENG